MEGQKKGQKKSLMNSYDLLQQIERQINDLAALSRKLLEKMNRDEDRPHTEDVSEKESKSDNNPDIIDLFDLVAEKMGQQINTVGDNLTRVINMID